MLVARESLNLAFPSILTLSGSHFRPPRGPSTQGPSDPDPKTVCGWLRGQAPRGTMVSTTGLRPVTRGREGGGVVRPSPTNGQGRAKLDQRHSWVSQVL